MKFLLIGTGGIFLFIILWQGEGWTGKVIVIAIAAFIIAGTITKTHSEYFEDKIGHQIDSVIEEQTGERFDRLYGNFGKIASRFQKYLDDSKEGDDE
jgi:hypothetical protein